jgi:alcohol dehydrogenase class IV
LIGPFTIARLPRIIFGEGSVAQLPDCVRRAGERTLLVTGARSLQQSEHWPALLRAFEQRGITWAQLSVSGEPSPQLVDQAVAAYKDDRIEVVVGIGGGSVLDAAKAIAGLLRVGDSVTDYLEGVGTGRVYQGPAVPFIAVPTTAGTGSEATRNAVLSVQGADGFKKSFRDEQLVPEYALVDPALLAACPPELIAANGMDALTQLIESYVSLRANAFTDALARSGIEAARDGLLDWYERGAAAHDARSRMAYAALISGITLAQTGLGSVHGLASPLGAFFPIPHGVVCGTLVAAATQVNIDVMQQREPDNPALAKYAELGEILCKRSFSHAETAREALVMLLTEWTEQLQLPRLGAFNVEESDYPRIVTNSRGSSMRTNPVMLADADIERILLARG